MLPRAKAAAAATATKTAVQAPCADTAFKPMEMPSIAEPAMKIQSKGISRGFPRYKPGETLTDDEDEAKHLEARAAKEQSSRIVDAICLKVTVLERADDVRRPASEQRDEAQQDNARNKTEQVEGPGDGQDAQANLCFHHQGDGAQPADLRDSVSTGSLATERAAATKEGVCYISIIGTTVRLVAKDVALLDFGIVRVLARHVEAVDILV
jgi:hypothetical protein